MCHAMPWKIPAWICLAMMFVASAAGTVFAGDDRAAVDKVRIAFNAAYNDGDAEAMGAIIDGDAVWMPPTGEKAIIGKNRIVARYRAFFEKTRSTFELQPGDVRVCGQWAFLHGPWQRKDTEKAGGAIATHGGYYLMVFKKQPGGGWKIARDIWNDAGK